METDDVEMRDSQNSNSRMTSSQVALLSQRLVSVDFYSHPPNYLFDQVKNDFNGTELHWVPIIRIFGASKEGQKSCAHIHGVFPYLYIRQPPNGLDEKELARNLDDALNKNTVPTASTSNFKYKDKLKHVVQIVPVKGRSFYGYQNSDEVFLKIYFYTPFALTKASQLLANGSIMNQSMQPFESHISYIQQFFMDYNLFGMNLIHYSKVLFRRNESQKEFVRSFGPDQPRPHWSYSEMGEHLFQPESVKRMSTCELEFDVLADDILNRLEKRPRNSNPGIVAIWQDEMERRRLNGIENWSDIPIPLSQDRAFCGDIFETELLHRKTLLKKLEPYTYLAQKSNKALLSDSVLPDDLLPASSQTHSQSSQLFLPQVEADVSFLAKERALSQGNSQTQEDDEAIIEFLEQLAHECQQEEPQHEEKSILNFEEPEDLECIIDSQTSSDPKFCVPKIIKVEAPTVANDDDVQNLEQEPENKEAEEADEEVWSASFMSQTFDIDELEILEPPLVETKSGSARTDPVCLASIKTKEARNQWNNDVLEKFMMDIMYGKHEPIDLNDPSGADGDGDELTSTANKDGEGMEIDPDLDPDLNPEPKVVSDLDISGKPPPPKVNPPANNKKPNKSKPKLTLAQKLFPNALLRPEQFLMDNNDSPSSSQEMFVDDEGQGSQPTSESKSNNQSEIILPETNKDSNPIPIPASTPVAETYQTFNEIWAKFPPIPTNGSQSQEKTDQEIQVNLLPSPTPMKDFECQSYPVYSTTVVQTEPMLPDGVSISTNTDPVNVQASETQTDSSTIDVIRTCGCRCSCGLQYMTALKASWEMAEKNKDRSVQTEESVLQKILYSQLHNHSDNGNSSSSPLPNPKRLRFDDGGGFSSDGGSPSGSGSSLRRKLYKQSDYNSPQMTQQQQEEKWKQRTQERWPLPPGTAGQSSKKSSTSRSRSQSKTDPSLVSSPKSSRSRRTSWETLKFSNPSKFSPQFDAVTKLLNRKAADSSSENRNQSQGTSQYRNRSPSSKKIKFNYQNQNQNQYPGQSQGHGQGSPQLPLPLTNFPITISPRTLDMSITSVYEYEAPDTYEQKILRFQAAKRGLRLFEFKHQQMLGIQRESAQRRKERRELRDSKIETKFAVHETIKPFKRTPQESFIASLVAQNEGLALPPLSDYYAEIGRDDLDLSRSQDSKNRALEPPNVCHFQGGNLSDEEGDENDLENEVENSQNSQNAPQNSSQKTSSSNSNIIEIKSTLPEDTAKAATVDCETPKGTQSSSENNVNTPKSILKSGSSIRGSASKAQKRLSQPQLRRRSIQWGVLSPENEKLRKQNSQNNNLDGSQTQMQQVLQSRSHSQASGGSNTATSFYNADVSELDGPSPMNPYNACMDVSNLQTARALHLCQFVTTMCVEVFCSKQIGPKDDGRVPDPLVDEMVAIFYTIYEDSPQTEEGGNIIRMLAVDLECCEESGGGHGGLPSNFPQWPNLKCAYFPDEISMLHEFLGLIRRYDPDILVGYEIHYMSWGYVIDRGIALGLPMTQLLSRLVPKEKKTKNGQQVEEASVMEWNETINGRIVLNLWRLLRHEMTVQSYTFESAMFNIMHEKVGLISIFNLNQFWQDDLSRHKTVDFYCIRVQGVLNIIDKLDLINRTSELARLFGIQFFEIFSRGSQFRVESMMLRLTKSDSLIPASPTVGQRAGMRAPAELPLIMEPYSKYYKDPVAVLDFQSLYPSIIIAYNYDYSTCLGRVEHLGREDRFELGCLDLTVSPVELNRFMSKNEISISPTGVAFLKSSVRRGILPEMLEQILETRLMVKRAIKQWAGQENKTLQKVLDSRQLGLKLIANVTYGYTAANFSGRMPCVEIADSVVSKGRETLERAIKLVEENEERWGGKVVYGDTDSMFIHFPNCPREKAFKFAEEIADEVTQMNPKPVKLKFEKIYQPCILQTKKRYVGFSYESVKQKVPKYDAKGIETVRRDGCPAVAKILEKSLRILFTTDDQEKVRKYLESQFQKILLGNVNLSEFTFAREYRGQRGYKLGAVVPALSIAERLRNYDRRSEPQPQERVPYVVIFGEPNRPLIHQIRTPREFVEQEGLRINSVYYIERALLPPLIRCFKLGGIDVQKWYSELPRRYLRLLPESRSNQQQVRGILDYFIVSMNCVGCDEKADAVLCPKCQSDPNIFIKLTNDADALSRKIQDVAQTCEYCALGVCMSLDCKAWQKLLRYDRVQQKKVEVIHRALNYYPQWQE